jgi:osmotically-inducible protein OsmY
MKSDLELKKAVLAELEFDSSVKVGEIGVSAKDGIVTLTGSAGSYAEKWAAARAVKRLAGVRGLAEDIVVKLPESARRTDTEIATTAVDAIKWLATVPKDTVKITVREGWISLEGAVDSWHQKSAAEEAVRNRAGVRGVTNLIVINPKVAPGDVKEAIIAAFERHALLDARQIQVETNGGAVVLRGNVRSLIEQEEAEHAAWAAKGVTQVENRMILAMG